ncbi:hypothetical protein ACFL0W_06170 [Nanoarchaeota archaeon]
MAEHGEDENIEKVVERIHKMVSKTDNGLFQHYNALEASFEAATEEMKSAHPELKKDETTGKYHSELSAKQKTAFKKKLIKKLKAHTVNYLKPTNDIDDHVFSEQLMSRLYGVNENQLEQLIEHLKTPDQFTQVYQRLSENFQNTTLGDTLAPLNKHEHVAAAKPYLQKLAGKIGYKGDAVKDDRLKETADLRSAYQAIFQHSTQLERLKKQQTGSYQAPKQEGGHGHDAHAGH